MKGGALKVVLVGIVALGLVGGAIVSGKAAQQEREEACGEWSDSYVAAVDAAIEDGSIQALATGEEPPPTAQKVLDLAEDKPEACDPPQTDIPFPASG